MIRKIRKKHLVALLALLALVAGVATGAMIMSSDSDGNTANADEFADIAGGGGGGGGIESGPKYTAAIGDEKGNGTGVANEVIRDLIKSKNGNFKCQNGVVWYVVYQSGVPAVRYGAGSTVDMNVHRDGNWIQGRVGGGIGDWAKYERYLNTKYTTSGNTYLNGTTQGWQAGCLMVPADTYGWYETTETGYELASKSTVNRSDLNACYIQYDNSAIGTDGYPKMGNGGRGYSYTKEDRPTNGHLAEGGNVVVTPYGELVDSLKDSKYSKPAGSADETNRNREELAERIANACKNTQNTGTSMTIPTDSDLSKAVAKGGIEKLMLTGKQQSVSYPIASNQWYWRKTTRNWRHVRNCNGQSAMTENGHYFTCTGGQSGNSDFAISNWAPENWQNDGGYHQRHDGTFVGYYCYDTGRGASEGEYASGCWNNVKNKTTVGYNRISFIPIRHHYLLNVLCNKTDFENYKSYFGTFGFTGEYSDNSIAGSGRFQASMISPVYYDNGTSSDTSGVFPRVAKLLARNGKLAGWHATGTDDHSVSQLYAHDYNAENDPVYSKECPFDCVASGTSNSAIAGNVGNGTSNKWDPALNRQGVKVTSTDTEGKLQADSKVSADMTFFRNNYWNQFRVDAWTPQNEESITYDGSNAKRTIVTRNEDATPWKKSNGASLQGYRQGDTNHYVNILNPGMAGGAPLGTQTSPSAAQVGTYGSSSGTSEGAITAVMNGQINDFRIKAPWASDAEMPIRLNVRYEYDVQNAAMVFTGQQSSGTEIKGRPTDTVKATSDGKCDATFTGAYKSTDDKNYQYTGAGTSNEIDRKLDGSDEFARAALIQFIRATAE